jgi:hypothetical protein
MGMPFLTAATVPLFCPGSGQSDKFDSFEQKKLS